MTGFGPRSTQTTDWKQLPSCLCWNRTWIRTRPSVCRIRVRLRFESDCCRSWEDRIGCSWFTLTQLLESEADLEHLRSIWRRNATLQSKLQPTISKAVSKESQEYRFCRSSFEVLSQLQRRGSRVRSSSGRVPPLLCLYCSKSYWDWIKREHDFF